MSAQQQPKNTSSSLSRPILPAGPNSPMPRNDNKNENNRTSSTATSAGLKQVSSIFEWLDGKVDEYLNTRVVILICVVVFMVYFVINALSGGGGDYENNSREATIFANVSILEIFLWAIFIVVVVVNGFQYFFNTNITTEISNLLSTKPEIVISQTMLPAEPDAVGGDLGSGPSLKMRKQVFHIPANIYDYDNAKALCDAYGAKLANIDQMEEAHKAGAEWCSYG